MSLAIPATVVADEEEILDDWPGRYEGRRDGKPATLIVREIERKGKRRILEFTLTSEDGPTFVGTGKTKADNEAHQVKNVTLQEVGGDGEIDLRRVFVHNFDRRFVTEEHRWGGDRYGGVYGPARFGDSDPGPTFDDDLCRWTGHYRVNNDGRQNRVLKVTSKRRTGNGIILDFTWTTGDGVVMRDEKKVRDHRVDHVRLRSADGERKVHLDRLYLHTWDTDFMSALVKWRGRHFGTSFKDDGELSALVPRCAASVEHYGVGVFGVAQMVDGGRIRQASRSSRRDVDLECLTVRDESENHCGFEDPVVFFGPLSDFGPDPVHMRVSGVSADTATVLLEEWEHLDGAHEARERTDYVAVEAGEHEFPSGQLVKADYVDGVDHRWSRVEFDRPFSERPVVLPQVVSVRGDDPVVPRLRNVSRRGFEIRLQEAEGGDEVHVGERVAIIALEPGSTVTGEYTPDGTRGRLVVDRVELDHRPKEVRIPYLERSGNFVAAVQTYRGKDAVHLRTGSGRVPGQVTLHLEEERSLDEETEHVRETVGYVATSGDWGPMPLEAEAERHVEELGEAPARAGEEGLPPPLAEAVLTLTIREFCGTDPCRCESPATLSTRFSGDLVPGTGTGDGLRRTSFSLGPERYSVYPEDFSEYRDGVCGWQHRSLTVEDLEPGTWNLRAKGGTHRCDGVILGEGFHRIAFGVGGCDD